MSKVAIVGSRNYEPLEDVKRYVDSLPADTIIISGEAPGVDRAAKWAAIERGLIYWPFPAKWHRPDGSYDGSAGAKRNAQMVAAADYIVAFWDGSSPGTAITIRIARECGKHVYINPGVQS